MSPVLEVVRTCENPVLKIIIALASLSIVPVSSAYAQNMTRSQENAVRSANSYLDFKGFSRNGLIDQLSSQYGDGYDVEDATIAVDSLTVDWDAQAARAAETYLEFKGFSCRGLIQQLSSEYGGKFTESQATFGAEQAGVC